MKGGCVMCRERGPCPVQGAVKVPLKLGCVLYGNKYGMCRQQYSFGFFLFLFLFLLDVIGYFLPSAFLPH